MNVNFQCRYVYASVTHSVYWMQPSVVANQVRVWIGGYIPIFNNTTTPFMAWSISQILAVTYKTVSRLANDNGWFSVSSGFMGNADCQLNWILKTQVPWQSNWLCPMWNPVHILAQIMSTWESPWTEPQSFNVSLLVQCLGYWNNPIYEFAQSLRLRITTFNDAISMVPISNLQLELYTRGTSMYNLSVPAE